ncbi:MAG: molybdenum cofactor biosynthesis protein MoaE [Candidatus Korarchaeota archaeon]|nr:molybdenum cofactor biosynthesis protein MoaE [Candidatus Korarchaeota archaeon]
MVPLGSAYVTESPIDTERELKLISSTSENIGAIVTFRGVVRGVSGGKEIDKLFYDYYPEMASDSLRKIRKEAISRFGLIDATVIHRVGEVGVGELALLVVTASEHRKEAFAAAQWIVDEVKRSTAIWKKEIFKGGGGEWVSEEG